MSKFFIWFVKITGYIVSLFYIRRKTYYVNKKLQNRKINEPSIIISNHTAIMDFPLYMYTFFGSVIRPLVAEVTYERNKPLKKLLTRLGAIKVDRDSYDFNFMGECINALEKGGNILIFPEGRLPHKDETEILPFKPSYIYIAMETNVPIIPVYTNGKYGIKGKTRVIIGEKIYINDLIDKTLSAEENIRIMNDYIRNYIINLRDELNEKEKNTKENI